MKTDNEYYNAYTTCHEGEQFSIVEKVRPFGNGFIAIATINGDVCIESDGFKTKQDAIDSFDEFDYFAEDND